MKFKIGDRVNVIGTSLGNIKFNEGLITGITSENNYKVKDVMGDGCDWNIKEIDLELILPFSSEPATKFKVGDEVRYCRDLTGMIGCIHDGIAYMSKCINNAEHKYSYPDGSTCTAHKHFMGYGLDGLELVEEQKIPELIILQGKTIKTKTMNIIDKIKQLALSKEDRALRDNGFEDDNGKMTSTAKEMMLEEILNEKWADRRKDVAGKLLEIKKEEK